MGLFDGFRRKPDEVKPEVAEAESAAFDGEDESLDGPASWYRTMYQNVVPAGDDVLLYDAERGAPVVLPTFELDLLAQCTHFASVDEHAAATARRTGLPADGIAQRLYELADRGLLISQQDVMARARAAAQVETEDPLTLDRVAVITSDRPASLDACLRSYRELYGADLELVVFDDSADSATREENRRVAVQAAAGNRILYAGEDEKRRLVTELTARSSVEPEVVRAAVAEFDSCTSHGGSNRNAVLLDAAGGAVLMVDDDTTARAVYPIGAGDGLRLSSRYDPWSVRFFARLEDALDAAEWRDVDLLDWHRRFLGQSPAACAFRPAARGMTLPLEADGPALDLNEADTAFIAAFSGGRGRVVATSAGLAGDSGMGLPLYFLGLQGQARERLLEDYESHRVTRAVHRGVDVATISNTRLFMTSHVAFDVRATIPPFSPVLRNADGTFGDLLRTCAPESYIAFLPWSVEHTPPEVRTTDFDQVVRSVSRVRANDIICDLARAHDPLPGTTDTAVRLRAFGHYLAALGAMPPADFDALLRYQITATVGRRIDGLTRVVNQNSGQPESWAKDCAGVVAEGLRALAEDEIMVADMPGATPEERSRRFQRLLYRFGRLIDAWPALLEAAKDLRVAQPLS